MEDAQAAWGGLLMLYMLPAMGFFFTATARQSEGKSHDFLIRFSAAWTPGLFAILYLSQTDGSLPVGVGIALVATGVGSAIAFRKPKLAKSTTTPSRPSSVRVPPPGASIKATFERAHADFLAFTRAHVRNIAPAQLSDDQAGFIYGLQVQLEEHFDATAAKAAFMLLWLSEMMRSGSFEVSAEMQRLELVAAGRFTYVNAQLMEPMASSKQEARKLALQAAAKEFARCKLATTMSIPLFQSRAPSPLDPVFRLLDEDLGLAKGSKASLESVYGEIARKIMNDGRTRTASPTPA